MIWLAAASCLGLAVYLIASDPPEEVYTEELAAAGWTPAAVHLTVAGLTAAVFVTAAGPLAAFTSPRTAVPAAAAVAVWTPLLTAARVKKRIVDHYISTTELALFDWMLRVRLYVSAGLTFTDAAVEAAQHTTAKGFAPVAAGISAALAGGRDPLTAAAARCKGTSVEPLLATFATVEQTGAAAKHLIDNVLDKAVKTLFARRQETDDRVGRAVKGLPGLMVVYVGGLLMIGVFVGISSTL